MFAFKFGGVLRSHFNVQSHFAAERHSESAGNLNVCSASAFRGNHATDARAYVRINTAHVFRCEIQATFRKNRNYALIVIEVLDISGTESEENGGAHHPAVRGDDSDAIPAVTEKAGSNDFNAAESNVALCGNFVIQIGVSLQFYRLSAQCSRNGHNHYYQFFHTRYYNANKHLKITHSLPIFQNPAKMRIFAIGMLGLKRLDSFILQRFLPLLVMTFFICTFIVLMQFLWLHLQDLVGKGVELPVLAELFTYAALSMVPMALPLAVLLASLMAFGNLGESLELIALKSGGISLFRVMRSLIVFMLFLSVGAFFFQNNVLPVAQTKMWTLLKSIRHKTPELDIVEGEFNYQLPNINIYVERKNRETGVLYGVMIYDLRQGFDRSRVILTDSATMRMAPDNTHMILNLHHGELFENLREAVGKGTARNMLYRREIFDNKMISVAFDINLEKMDEGDIRQLYVGQNVKQLTHTIDSMNHRIDSIGVAVGEDLSRSRLISLTPEQIPDEVKSPDVKPQITLDPDSARHSLTPTSRRQIIEMAKKNLNARRMENFSRSSIMAGEFKIMRRTGIELHRRFTLSVAVLVFFFIGAPLGAIIRKGGIGTPLIVSVILFIIYYIIDNSGYRMARDGQIPVWQGTWLSSGVLLPLGIFLTYKAVHDSAVFNADSYLRLWRIATGRNVRAALAVKEVVIEDFNPAVACELLDSLSRECELFRRRYPGYCGYAQYWAGGIKSADIVQINAALEHSVSYLSNSRSTKLLERVSTLPLLENFRILHPAPGRLSAVCKWFFPCGIIIRLLALPFEARLLKRIEKIQNIIPEIIPLLQHG